MTASFNRRTFNTTLAAGATVASLTATAKANANERIRLAVIGTANRGGQLIAAFNEHADAEIVALCDIDSRSLTTGLSKLGREVETTNDFRKLLDRKDIDAIVVASPDHWHAIQTTHACAAGKDVYVEKPLSTTIVEGRAMVDAARKYNRIVQVGTHRRSSPLYIKMAPRIRDGLLGKVTVARAYRVSNMAPSGIGRMQASEVPAELDWDTWLGPRAHREYQGNITPYKFRWWDGYSSQMGNWGVHYLDVIRWSLGEEAPQSICAMGGRFAVDDDRTIPDTMEVTFQFASGALAIFGQYEASGIGVLPQGDVELRGTNGLAYLGEQTYEVISERPGQFQRERPMTTPETADEGGSNHALTVLHARNFLDCVKSRKQPNADVEIGHRSTSFTLLANISLQLGRRLEWDAAAEKFINDNQANELLHYEYRRPWALAT
jgi:predicted dehydrogenase